VVDRSDAVFRRLKEEVKSPKVTILLSREAGLSSCRNLALDHVKGDAVAFLDDDAVADRDWLRRLAKCYDENEVISVGGRIEPHPSTPIPESYPEEMYWVFGCTYKGHPTEKGEIRNTFGSNISFRRSIFNQIGIFDCSLGRVDNKNITAEETELCLRIHERYPNQKILFEPSALIYHRVYASRKTLRYVLNRGFGEGYSKAIINKKFKDNGALSVENNVLNYILKESIPIRIKKIVNGKESGRALKQLAILLLTSVIVVTGFAVGKITPTKVSR
jgi:cellulose synthase/poly-beta-1,6-N-acetylglucosamine synthase-like glycosyltransferase